VRWRPCLGWDGRETMGRSMVLPAGTVTLLFSDIEGSTRLLEQLGEGYSEVLDDHRVRGALAAYGGHEVRAEGDAFFVALVGAGDAVRSAVAAQRALATCGWPDGVAMRVRMGVHTGEPRVVGGDYVGMDVHRAAGICSAAHGGQVVVSEATQRVLARQPTDGVRLRDLGEHRLKDLARPLRLYQVTAGGLMAGFPPLRAIARRSTDVRGAFVGRASGLAEFVGGLEDALAGRGRLFLLAGEPGIGKSRLVSMPLAAAAAGWLLVGRAPPAIARTVIE
jgi:class 3 adenylate cyclase